MVQRVRLRRVTIGDCTIHGYHSRDITASIDVINELFLLVDTYLHYFDFSDVLTAAKYIHVLIEIVAHVIECEIELSDKDCSFDLFDVFDFEEFNSHGSFHVISV